MISSPASGWSSRRCCSTRNSSSVQCSSQKRVKVGVSTNSIANCTQFAYSLVVVGSRGDHARSARRRPWQHHANESPAMLQRLQQAVMRNGNVFEVLMDAVRVCSLGQITIALFEVGGSIGAACDTARRRRRNPGNAGCVVESLQALCRATGWRRRRWPATRAPSATTTKARLCGSGTARKSTLANC